MKRCEQLQKLSQEHHDSFAMVNDIARTAQEGSDEQLAQAIQTVQQYYNNELEIHFQHEERTIFAPIFKQYREHIGLATHLLKEHGYLRLLIQRMELSNAKKDLADFAEVLKRHTEIEENELFPLVESLFTDEQLAAVVDFEPLD